MHNTQERTDAVFRRAEQRRRVALHILTDLEILERWSAFGRPVLVGAVTYDLVLSPDIDLEIYCPVLRIDDGFAVLRACAQHPAVIQARFANHLAGRDQALYWQLWYRHTDGEVWKIDMWSAPETYDLPRAEDLVAPMQRALTPALRATILTLKERRQVNPELDCPSIDLYRAVLDDGVRTEEALQAWLAHHPSGALTSWRP